MNLRFWSLALFSAIILLGCLALPLVPETIQPFDATPSADAKGMVILQGSNGQQMPPELRPGDVMPFKEMSPDTRSYFMVGSINPPAGTLIDVPVQRADGLHHFQVPFQATSILAGGAGQVIDNIANIALLLLQAALGLLLLWRGQSRATFGVALWCLTSVIQSFMTGLPIPMPYGKFLAWSWTILATIGTLVGLYLVADGLTAAARPERRRRIVHVIFTVMILAYLVAVTAYNGTFYFTGENVFRGINIVVSLHFAAFVTSLSIMGFSYKRTSPLDQARIRWVLFSLLGLLLGYVISLLGGLLALRFDVLNFIGTVLTAATLAGFAYAVLKHRLVSLQLVLNRALVYGLITSLVVGVFAALLSFLERNAIHSETNQFLALLIPLILGMGMNALKRQVDERINSLFFRNRHKAEADLTQFARTAPYVEDPEKLLDLAAQALYRNSGAEGLAIYFTQKGKAGPKLVRKQGDLPLPTKLDTDDLALLRLKAGDAEVDLHSTFSALGTEGYAYALTVRGEVMGFIVLGTRPSDAYTLEERRLFGLVAHQVAVALHGLRLQEQQSLLRDLAEGVFKSLPKARAKAKELVAAA